jgi:hypothetical protein
MRAATSIPIGNKLDCRRRSPGAPFFRRFDGLAIDNGGTGFGFTPNREAQLLTQSGVNAFPGPVDAPLAKIVVNRRPGWQIMRRQPPRTAAP